MTVVTSQCPQQTLKAWIIGAKRLASSFCSNCVRCRFLHKLKVQQKMAELPSPLQLPCPPFTNVGVDLCGPLMVHAMTNKRATMKVWNVLFVCLNTKAVTMYLAPGYSTKDFFICMAYKSTRIYVLREHACHIW